MAKTRIQTVNIETLQALVERIEALERKVLGNLHDDEKPLDQSPDDIVVLVPTGGIAARSGTTCYSEDCNRYVITDSDPDDDEITLTALLDGNSDPVTAKVFNLADSAIGEGKYVVTSRLKSGHRYVVLEPCG